MKKLPDPEVINILKAREELKAKRTLMNERIRELASQAQEDYVGYQDKGLYYEIFAKMIVKECAELVKDGVIEQQAGDSNTYTSVGAADTILEHFGIEE